MANNLWNQEQKKNNKKFLSVSLCVKKDVLQNSLPESEGVIIHIGKLIMLGDIAETLQSGLRKTYWQNPETQLYYADI